MKRIKIFKVYFILWLFVYFIAISNIESFKLYFLSTLTFNIAIVTLLAIGTIMLLKGAKEVVMIAGTFGVLMYKKRNLPFYIMGIEKVLPANIASKISKRAKSNMLLFTQQEKEEILSWIDEQFSNQNKYNNFFIGTVLMIGLLGTFSGLLGAIASMGNIVMSLSGSDIDIGKIMASFSGPLSSMAVGFGSSLFGVISAILLSIKGYLLNRSQASVLDGVENWLNATTVENMDTLESSNNAQIDLVAKQPHFLDIFVEKMGLLNQHIVVLNENNADLKQKFSTTVSLMKNMQNTQIHTLEHMIKSMENLQIQTNHNTHQSQTMLTVYENMQEKQQDLLCELVDLQKDEKYQMSDLNVQLEDLNYGLQKEHEHSKVFHQNILTSLENKSLDNENNMLLFQLLDAMEGMQKDLIQEIRTIKEFPKNKLNNISIKEENGFLQRHFKRKNPNIKEKV